VRFRFIQEHLGAFPVDQAAGVLRVSRSGYYAWRGRQPSSRQARREDLGVRIKAVHEENHRVYGSPRVCAALKAQGQNVCENTVARLMKERGVRAKSKKKFVPRTTDAAHAKPVAPNLLERDFAAARPDQKWVADITYVPTDQGWLYLAVVLDLCARKVVGWSMADHMEATLIRAALEMALLGRHPRKGLLHHSDRGVQYASDDYQHLLASRGITCSMSGKGNCYDNAVMESFWGTLKTELIHHQRYATHAQARQSIFEYIEVFYNRKRLHSSLGYVSPEAFEARLN
jgi:transposase InsO family protein